ncbi:MAG: pyridoxal-phosphate dependent enzyme, partial [Deltaproteobacteria bacterium]|nr:pyridoxal-phosphate dependent enzyme [Deltaproteobacteria bacterium]
MNRDHSSRLRALSSLIGNTPLLLIEFLFQGKKREIYAKAEHLNMTGSIKDRMAFHIIENGYGNGLLKPGKPIMEATSGNTGISLAAIGRALGHPVTIFMPDWMSAERVSLLRSLGAKVVLVDRSEQALRAARRLADRQGVAVRLWHVDLEEEGVNPLGEEEYAAIVVFRYLHRPLIPCIRKAVAGGGILVYETYTVEQPRFGKPHNPDFLLKPG